MALGKGSPNLKESNPIAAAEYAVARDIEDVLPFAWWLSITLTKRESIISDVKKSVLKKTHKFGTRVPKDAKEAGRTICRSRSQDVLG